MTSQPENGDTFRPYLCRSEQLKRVTNVRYLLLYSSGTISIHKTRQQAEDLRAAIGFGKIRKITWTMPWDV